MDAGGASTPMRKNHGNPRVSLKNHEGYVDSTAYSALTSVMRSHASMIDDADARNNKLIKALKQLIDLAGFDLVDRIAVRDRRTGKTYR